MLSRVLWFIRTYLIWIIFFVLCRVVFATYMYHYSSEYSLSTILTAFGYGLRHDASTAGYIMLLNGLTLFLTSIFRDGAAYNFAKRAAVCLNCSLIALASLISSLDNEVYRNWERHIDSTPLMYFNTPEVLFASTPISIFMMGVFIMLTSIVVGVYLLKTFSFKHFPKREVDITVSERLKRSAVMLLITAFTIIPVRGGFSIVPINSGSVYFHKDLYPNHLAVNGCWNFIKSVSMMGSQQESYTFMDEESAAEIVSSLNVKTDIADTKTILNNKRPNIVVVLLEGISSKNIGALGAEAEFTPNISRIANESVLFTNIYSSSFRSDRGLVSLLSGFPAQPRTSVMKYPEKTVNLPFISKELIDMGYNASYFHGGNINFCNMNSYFTNGGFSRLVGESNFGKEVTKGHWGVQDKDMFNYFYNEIVAEAKGSSSDQRHLNMLFTLSSHEPFDIPERDFYKGDDEESMFINTVFYADKYLGQFYDKLKTSGLWDNTLIIITSDHGHRLPYETKYELPISYSIPLIFAGGAVDDSSRGLRVDRVGSNCDIAPTLLRQMGVNDVDKFEYSKDLLNSKSVDYAYYSTPSLFGFLSDSLLQVYSLESMKYIGNTVNGVDFNSLDQKSKESTPMFGEAYLQQLWNSYLNL